MKLRQMIWQQYSSQTLPPDQEVHVWSVDLNQNPFWLNESSDLLSSDEKQRAEKFRFERDRKRFIVARGALRKILGAYLKISAREINFSYNQYGKPFLTENDRQLKFNLAHTEGRALVAVSQRREIGVDIEFIRDDFATCKTANFFFSSTEISALETLPRNLRTNAFFCGWTRKEAVLKAVGNGFSYPPKEITVSMMPDETLFSLQVNERQKTSDWSVIQLSSEKNYPAALAVQGKIQTVYYC
jgi:4'-phosphopantetheinyl transferase